MLQTDQRCACTNRPALIAAGSGSQTCDNLLQRLRALAKAADAISAGDVVNVSVRRYGNWGLMPFGALLGCVVPAAYMHGPRETFEMYENVSCYVQACRLACPWAGSR
jgi:hypothetical protein